MNELTGFLTEKIPLWPQQQNPVFCSLLVLEAEAGDQCADEVGFLLRTLREESASCLSWLADCQLLGVFMTPSRCRHGSNFPLPGNSQAMLKPTQWLHFDLVASNKMLFPNL